MNCLYQVSFVQSITDVSLTEWSNIIDTDYPFIQYHFIKALEDSMVVSEKSGWQPYHLIGQEKGQGEEPNKIKFLMLLYIKTHSYGEYVFDFQWANAYHQAGIEYYPKLLTAIPFTPCTAQRIYYAKDVDQKELLTALNNAIQQACKKYQLSSWHCLFCTQNESEILKTAGYISRVGMQYHWFNQNYHSFDDFLAHCQSKSRKNIKRERRIVSEQGIKVSVLEGGQIDSTIWACFFQFYQMTYLKKSGHTGYLNKVFFDQLGETMKQSIVMVIAKIDSNIIAASLFFKDTTTLYGRYWGCIEEFNYLHFELCYYQGIEYCIQHNLKKFDAGAQGEHKIQRGFKPIKTLSAHWINHSSFADAINQFVKEEEKQIDQAIETLAKKLPFK